MKRHWNWRIWAGLLATVAAVVSYEFFSRFPVTRDFPWANLLLFALAFVLLGQGLARAFRQPAQYRGRIFGSIVAALALSLFAIFSYELFYVVRQVPRSAGAPQVGQEAPTFTLPDQAGKSLSLAELISPNGAVLIFYRGHW